MIEYGIDVPNYIECLPKSMYVTDIEFGVRKTKWGFEIPKETMDKNCEFIRPRWAKVLWKSNDIKEVDVGDWVLMRHGNWSTSIKLFINGEEKKVWFISPKSYKEGLLAKSREIPKHLKEYGIE